MSLDLLFQNFDTAQSNQQPGPVTTPAATTIAPQSLLTIVTGTTAIAQLTPPLTGQHMLAIVASATNFSGFLTTGNILVASITNSVLWANKVSLFFYNPLTAKYHPLFGTAT